MKEGKKAVDSHAVHQTITNSVRRKTKTQRKREEEKRS
jgi:hypothetical protein